MNLSEFKIRINAIYLFEWLRRKTKKYIQKGDGCLVDKDIVFLVFLPATDYYYLPYFQLYQFKNVFVDFSYVNSNLFISKLQSLFTPQSPYKKFAKVKYDKTKKYVIFFDGQYALATHEFRQYLQQEYPGCQIIFHLGDLIRTKKGIDIEDIKAFADFVVTYDHNDADNYELNYHPDAYSKLPEQLLKEDKLGHSALLFHGFARNREETIIESYDYLIKNGIDCVFNVPGLSKEALLSRPELSKSKNTPYIQYLKYVQKTDCIFEVLQKGSQGCTFRTWEAVVYNKKLLTNNPSVKDEPFYNPKFIKVFTSPEDIDVEWLKTPIQVDYNFAEKLYPEACFQFYVNSLTK